ncbi:UNVERIFIED_CONTAM: hypothetical protein RMT77_004122 [Armadillidium vulgare]
MSNTKNHENQIETCETNFKSSSNDSISENTSGNASRAYEIILKECGDYHLYQWWLTFLGGLTGIFTGMHGMAAIFLAATPSHICKIPYIESDNYSLVESMSNITTPWIKDNEGNMISSSCVYFTRSINTSSNLNFYQEQLESNFTSETKCTQWIYDDTDYKATIATEWDLVCDNKWYISGVQSTFMIGYLVGALIFSAISDKKGRRYSTLVGVCLLVISSISIAFVNSYTMFIILRLILAASAHGIGLSTFVLLIETVSSKGRNVMINLSACFFTFGFLFLVLLAYYIREWRKLQLTIGLPSLLLFSYFCLLPESPRWLLMSGKEEQGIKLLKSIAKMNKKKFPSDDELMPLLQLIRNEIKFKTNESGLEKLKSTFDMVLTLVRTKNMRRRNLISFYAWFVASMSYYGLIFSGATIKANLYVSAVLSAVIELPQMIILIVSLLYLGRRTIYCFGFLLGGVSCIAIAFIPTDPVGWNIALTTIGKLGVGIAFTVAYIMTAELVPTHVRNIAIGMCSVISRIGSGTAPFIVDLLGDIYYAIPFIIFGVLAMVSAFLILLLPETGTKRLPESVEEIELLPR